MKVMLYPPFCLYIFLQQLLECNKCRNSYHPECLGPNYPTKPTKKKKVWVSTHIVFQRELSWDCGPAQLGVGISLLEDVGVIIFFASFVKASQ